MGRLLSVGRQSKPAFHFGEHTHNAWEISYYNHGTGINTINGVKYRFSKGTVICQPPGLPHSEDSAKGYKNYFFSIDNVDFPADKPIIFKDTVNNDFFNVLHQLYYENLLDGHEKISEALCFVLEEYIRININKDEDDAPYVEQLRHTLMSNLSNPDFSVSDEMSKYPLSVNYLRDLFTENVGMSPKQFLQNIRIEQAEKLFRSSSLSVSDVSMMCGFADPYYFSRFFKKKTGVSPSDYKEGR